MIDMFPGVNFNLRGSSLRCDIMTPLGPNEVMIEFRGLGLKSDDAVTRRSRVDHHNSHENETIHDENGMRHFYEEWGRWMNRQPSNPDKPFVEPVTRVEAEKREPVGA